MTYDDGSTTWISTIPYKDKLTYMYLIDYNIFSDTGITKNEWIELQSEYLKNGYCITLNLKC